MKDNKKTPKQSSPGQISYDDLKKEIENETDFANLKPDDVNYVAPQQPNLCIVSCNDPKKEIEIENETDFTNLEPDDVKFTAPPNAEPKASKDYPTGSIDILEKLFLLREEKEK